MDGVPPALSLKEVAGHKEQSPPLTQPQPQTPLASMPSLEATGTRSADLGDRHVSDRHHRTPKLSATGDNSSVHAFAGADATDAHDMGRVKAGSFAGLGCDSAAVAAVTGVFAEVTETAAEGVR